MQLKLELDINLNFCKPFIIRFESSEANEIKRQIEILNKSGNELKQAVDKNLPPEQVNKQ